MDERGKKIKKYLIWEEIKSQSKVWEYAINKFLKKQDEILNIFKNHRNIYFIGSGSSYNSSLIAKLTYDVLFNKRAICAPSSEFFINSDDYVKSNSSRDRFLMVSRTGETADTVLAHKSVKRFKGYTISLTASPNSTLAKICDYSMIFEEILEKSITSTMSTTSSTIILLSLIFMLVNRKSLIDKIYSSSSIFFNSFDDYSKIISSIINRFNFNRITFLGTGPLYGLAREAALKSKEMSITNTEFSHTLEYRQGYNTIADENSLIVLFRSEKAFDYESKIALELKNVGAIILSVCDKRCSENLDDKSDFMINVNLNLEDLLKPVFFQVIGQLIGYHQAEKKGIDPSYPRYIDRVVTF